MAFDSWEVQSRFDHGCSRFWRYMGNLGYWFWMLQRRFGLGTVPAMCHGFQVKSSCLTCTGSKFVPCHGGTLTEAVCSRYHRHRDAKQFADNHGVIAEGRLLQCRNRMHESGRQPGCPLAWVLGFLFFVPWQPAGTEGAEEKKNATNSTSWI